MPTPSITDARTGTQAATTIGMLPDRPNDDIRFVKKYIKNPTKILAVINNPVRPLRTERIENIAAIKIIAE